MTWDVLSMGCPDDHGKIDIPGLVNIQKAIENGHL
jgi:hypothetical protein